MKKIANIVHIASYVYHLPSEGLHGHCVFPLTAKQMPGIPPLALFGSDCVEICAKAIESEAIGVENCDELNEDECKILIRAASAIARKRKNLN